MECLKAVLENCLDNKENIEKLDFDGLNPLDKRFEGFIPFKSQDDSNKYPNR